jgi:phage tail P2-like protein
MNNIAPTLPPNTTALERAIAVACAKIVDIPVPIRDLWNPDRCRVDLLPFLAWACSVDRWDDTWPESIKRGSIKAAYYIHKHKGTIAAVRRVVESMGYLSKIVEWWQTEPKGQRGTFSLEVGVQDKGITEALYIEMARLIDDARPLSRHLKELQISLDLKIQSFSGVWINDGDEIDIYPWPSNESPSTL